jgi:hypothetical protein
VPSAADNGPQINPQAELLAEVAALIASAAPLYEPTLHLVQQNIAVTPTTPLSVLTAAEASFPGYAAVTAIAWGAPGNSPTGGAEVFAPSHTFTQGASPIPQTIFGWYITDSGVTVLLRYVALANPVPVVLTGDQVTIQPALQFN